MTAGSDGSGDCSYNAGYTGSNGGTCAACVEGKYKSESGPGVCANCGAGKYSSAVGAISEATCAPTIAAAPAHFVRLVLSLPLSKTAFTVDKQAKFKEAIAAAAGVSRDDVTIEEIEDATFTKIRFPQLRMHSSLHYY